MRAGRNSNPRGDGYASRMVADALARRETDTNRIRTGAFDGLTRRGFSPMTADYLSGAIDLVPGLGDVSGAEDAYQGFSRGDMLGGGIAAGATLLGLVPGVGDFASKAVRSAADGAGGAARKGIRAFHGSPHDFDKFSLDKIGTGEGAQAYGHGLYFAESEGVARSYRDALTRGSVKQYVYRGSDIPYGTPEYDLAYSAFQSSDGIGSPSGAPFEDALARVVDRYRASLDSGAADRIGARREIEDFLSRVDAGSVREEDFDLRTPGRLYEVEIDANPEDFLDWDRPLSEQPERVRAALQPQVNAALRQELVSGVETGGDAYGAAVSLEPWDVTRPNQRTDAAAATERLRAAGIPGIRYLDAGSRTAGDGSRNYVVFDDSLVEIIRKYGLAGLMAMGGMGALYGAQSPAQEY